MMANEIKKTMSAEERQNHVVLTLDNMFFNQNKAQGSLFCLAEFE